MNSYRLTLFTHSAWVQIAIIILWIIHENAGVASGIYKHEYLTSIGGSGRDLVSGLSAIPTGGCYLVGGYQATAEFGVGEDGIVKLTSPSGMTPATSGFLVKYNSIGKPIWAKTLSNILYPGNDSFKVATAMNSGAFVVGTFYATWNLSSESEGGITLVSKGGHDCFVAKCNPDGSFAWAKSAGGIAESDINGIVSTKDGNVIFYGTFEDEMTFNEGEYNQVTLNAEVGSNWYAACYDADGNFLWAHNVLNSPINSASLSDMSPTLDGGVMICGNFWDSIALNASEYDQTTLTSTGQYNFYLAHLKNDGRLDWIRNGSSQTGYYLFDSSKVIGLSDGGAMIYGGFKHELHFSGGSAQLDIKSRTDEESSFMAKYDQNGQLLWAQSILERGAVYPEEISQSAPDRIALVGEFSGSILVGEGSPNAITLDGLPGKCNLYLAEYSTNGIFIRAERIGYGDTFIIQRHMDFTPNGSLLLAGDFGQNINLGDLTAQSRGNKYDGYLVQSKPSSVTLLSPNGGENLGGDSVITISWITNLIDAGSGVRFELWNDLGHVQDLGYGWNQDGLGSSQIYLPLVPEDNTYRIRIVSTWNPSLYDESDESIIISGGPIRIFMPNGGEILNAGDHEWIWWQSNPLISGTGVTFELWRSGIKVADLGIGWDPDGESLSTILVPSVPPDNDYKVRVISAWNPSWYDESDASFTIYNINYRTAVIDKQWLFYQ